MNNKARLAVDSLTYAMQARDLLVGHGINAGVVRLHKSESSLGCAFGIELARQDVQSALSLLDRADINSRLLKR